MATEGVEREKLAVLAAEHGRRGVRGHVVAVNAKVVLIVHPDEQTARGAGDDDAALRRAARRGRSDVLRRWCADAEECLRRLADGRVAVGIETAERGARGEERQGGRNWRPGSLGVATCSHVELAVV